MKKISWYWWVIGGLLFLLLIGGSATDNAIESTTQSPEVANNQLDEYSEVTVFGEGVSLDVIDNQSDEVVVVLEEAGQTTLEDALPVTTYEVVRVIDGDTIEIMYEGVKRKLRYIGVDTPETVHPSKPVECMGKEASAFNKSLVEGKSVRLERDVSDTDKYGRLLRYVYIGDVMVNEVLAAEGYANVMTYPPDVKYNERFRLREQEAREQKKGLWSGVCGDTTGGVASAPTVAQSSPNDATCRIKGNISSSKEKIYHVPGCKSYDKTVINEDAGERWFCTEQEALSAGWRKALNCS